MSFFPSDPKRLKARIRSYDRALKAPNCDDGYGKRFLVGTMYLLLGDPEGALGFYNWYVQQFPSEMTDPLNHLSWALSLFRTGRHAAAESKLLEAAFENPHVFDWLNGNVLTRLDIWYGSNWSEPEYLDEAPPEYRNLWKTVDLNWAYEFSRSESVAGLLGELISIQRRLNGLAVGPERSQLVSQLYEIQARLHDSQSPGSNVIPLRS